MSTFIEVTYISNNVKKNVFKVFSIFSCKGFFMT